jgi:hypothetical protein
MRTDEGGDMAGGSPRPNTVLNRAFAAGAGLCAAVLAVTGVFIARIEKSYAATHSGSTGSPSSSGLNDPGTSSSDGFGDGSGGGAISPPPQLPHYQLPQGRTHGS